MSIHLFLALAFLFLLNGCGVEEFIRKNDDRYATPGAMDSPLTGIYNTYQYSLLDKYQISHQWLESGCRYRGVEQPSSTKGLRTRFFLGQSIVEKDGKTWLRFSQDRLFDFDPWVRSVKWVSKEKGKEGQVREVGLQPVCWEDWWTSSHYLMLRLQKRSLAEFENVFTQRYPEGEWRSQSLNGLDWRVQQVPVTKLRPRPPNGLGGPYQAWLVALGDTGYVMSIEMGASKESLGHPQAHAAVQGVLLHLVNSLQIQRLAP
jgi:hypothetical protein